MRISKQQQALYALSAFAVILSIGRVFYSGQLTFLFLAWNLFLAWIPYWISTSQFKFHQKITYRSFIFVAIWLAFLPNAPYLVTDFVHFHSKGQLKWLDIVLLSSYAIAGMLLFHRSLQHFRFAFLSQLSLRLQHLVILLILFSSAYGIYLGRILRFNSWDVVIRPLWLTESIFRSVFDPNHFKYTMYITGLFLVFLYVSVLVFDHLSVTTHEEKN